MVNNNANLTSIHMISVLDTVDVIDDSNILCIVIVNIVA